MAAGVGKGMNMGEAMKIAKPLLTGQAERCRYFKSCEKYYCLNFYHFGRRVFMERRIRYAEMCIADLLFL